jgi:glycosyltransferase involved in cell wall biosynthesis
VLSTFAYNSFVAERFDRAKLSLLPLGTNTTMFRPTPEVVEARCRRIEAGEPLRVLYVGTPSLRKGLLDVAATIRKLKGGNFSWRFVGPVGAEAKAIKAELSAVAEFIPKQPQSELPKWYEWGDVFILPTIEDGFAVVLAQAQAAGLPILATTNCSSPDHVREGETGWVLPIRSPEAFIDRLLWCDAHREELAQMVRRAYTYFRPRDWDDVAADFESLVNAELLVRRSQPVGTHGR